MKICLITKPTETAEKRHSSETPQSATAAENERLKIGYFYRGGFQFFQLIVLYPHPTRRVSCYHFTLRIPSESATLSYSLLTAASCNISPSVIVFLYLTSKALTDWSTGGSNNLGIGELLSAFENLKQAKPIFF